MNKSHIKASIIIEILSVVAAVYGLCLTIKELQSFTYYTTISNILMIVTLIIALYFRFSSLKKDTDVTPNGFYIFKYMMTVAISLTFLIYMCILAPTTKGGFLYAYFSNFAGSFGVHFVGPLLAIVDHLLYDYNLKSKNSYCIYAVLPPIAYVIGIVILAETGMRWKGMHAPYNFLNYGAETGWFGWDLSKLGGTSLGIGVAYLIFVLIIIFMLIGLLFLWVKNRRHKKFCA